MPHHEPVRTRVRRRGDDHCVIDLLGLSRPRCIVQPGQTVGGTAITPVDHRRPAHPNRSAAAIVPNPSATASTICARTARPARTVLDRVHDVNTARSRSVRVEPAVAMHHHRPHPPANEVATRDISTATWLVPRDSFRRGAVLASRGPSDRRATQLREVVGSSIHASTPRPSLSVRTRRPPCHAATADATARPIPLPAGACRS